MRIFEIKTRKRIACTAKEAIALIKEQAKLNPHHIFLIDHYDPTPYDQALERRLAAIKRATNPSEGEKP